MGNWYYHSHLAEVYQTMLGNIQCALFDEGEIRQIHAQIGYAWWVTAVIKQLLVKLQ